MALVSGYGRIVDVIEFLWGVNPKFKPILHTFGEALLADA